MLARALRPAIRWLRRKSMQWNTQSRVSHGIPMWITTTGKYGTHDELYARVDAALELIERHSPWRMRRVRTDVPRIWLYRQAYTRASYRYDARAAILDTYFVMHHPPEAVAASIVHEAVHARLGKHAFERTRAWEERMCRRAEVDLGRHLPNGAAVIARAQAAYEASDEDVAPAVDWKEAGREQQRAGIRELDLPGWLERWLLARVR